MFKQMGFPGGSVVRNPAAMQKTQVQSLGRQDPLEKGMTEDEMVGWHHRLNGHGFGWTLELDCLGSNPVFATS